MRLSRWARAALMIGAILLGLGLVPLWLVTNFLPGADPLIFALAFFLLVPLGTVIFALGIILLLFAWLNK
ncbi:hypothetical protein MNBD_ALPHA12-376 [hydrothermal vent metagenome]|uniref:Uncharacterized protein n=1 Tax=hydrothermal vent metagenome TaxID=652676 RepID=A0A3B0TI16_9ZZZZ